MSGGSQYTPIRVVCHSPPTASFCQSRKTETAERVMVRRLTGSTPTDNIRRVDGR
ncbi:hypothetical protein FRUB_02761 [Fimbriiglobus ruber]|uniref:Uncharacterized protein n=1 Tax=Fimbriiglobus ruber TaxID=1908690 RepID=A0A225DP35_9BACT|nr:hypothetical protein FRUB_02761 [Fimbriiglobus ruber]